MEKVICQFEIFLQVLAENVIFLFRYYYEKCPEIVSKKKTVYVGIALYLMNLHSVDMKAGTFHADFYLYFKGKNLFTCKLN